MPPVFDTLVYEPSRVSIGGLSTGAPRDLSGVGVCGVLSPGILLVDATGVHVPLLELLVPLVNGVLSAGVAGVAGAVLLCAGVEDTAQSLVDVLLHDMSL